MQTWTKHDFPHPLRGLSLPALCEAYGVEIVPAPDARPQWNALARVMADGGPFMNAAGVIKALNFEYRRDDFRDEAGEKQRGGLALKE